MRTCHLVLLLSHYLATSMLMKTRHLVILLSHYLAISYHLELPPADGLSLFHSTFTCEHSTREQGKENCEWWLLVFAVCLFYHVSSCCILPYEALDKVFKIKMHCWPHRTKVPVLGVPKKRGCGEKKASVLCGANLLLAKSSKAAALSLFLLGILWHYALKVVGNVFCGQGTQAGAQFAFNLFNVFSPHRLSNLSLARKCGICFCLKMDILLLFVNIMMIIIMRTITGV